MFTFLSQKSSGNLDLTLTTSLEIEKKKITRHSAVFERTLLNQAPHDRFILTLFP